MAARLTYVREVAAAGTFGSGGRRHTYATFHAVAPVVIATCGHAANAARRIHDGRNLPPCEYCTWVESATNVQSHRDESGGENP